MLVIPLAATPSQAVNVTLAGQNCRVAVYQKSTGVYVDLSVEGDAIVTGVIAQVGNRLVRRSYSGFVGDLAFFDLQPSAGGGGAVTADDLGGRFFLAYLP